MTFQWVSPRLAGQLYVERVRQSQRNDAEALRIANAARDGHPVSITTLDQAEAAWGKGSPAVYTFRYLMGFTLYIRTPKHQEWSRLPSTRPWRGPYLCRTHADCLKLPALAHACWERTRETRAAKRGEAGR